MEWCHQYICIRHISQNDIRAGIISSKVVVISKHQSQNDIFHDLHELLCGIVSLGMARVLCLFVSKRIPNNYVMFKSFNILTVLSEKIHWPAQWVQVNFEVSQHHLASFWRQTSTSHKMYLAYSSGLVFCTSHWCTASWEQQQVESPGLAFFFRSSSKLYVITFAQSHIIIWCDDSLFVSKKVSSVNNTCITILVSSAMPKAD